MKYPQFPVVSGLIARDLPDGTSVLFFKFPKLSMTLAWLLSKSHGHDYVSRSYYLCFQTQS